MGESRPCYGACGFSRSKLLPILPSARAPRWGGPAGQIREKLLVIEPFEHGEHTATGLGVLEPTDLLGFESEHDTPGDDLRVTFCGQHPPPH